MMMTDLSLLFLYHLLASSSSTFGLVFLFLMLALMSEPANEKKDEDDEEDEAECQEMKKRFAITDQMAIRLGLNGDRFQALLPCAVASSRCQHMAFIFKIS